MLGGVSLICFTASYWVALALEASRLVFRLPVRWLAIVGFSAAGLLAHTIYLGMEARRELGHRDKSSLGQR